MSVSRAFVVAFFDIDLDTPDRLWHILAVVKQGRGVEQSGSSLGS
jgi:hypothetical protein